MFDVESGRFPLAQCEGCGVAVLHPQPDDAQLSAVYAPSYYGSSPRKFIKPIAMLVSVLQRRRAQFAARYVPAGGRVLDVGCGNGGFLLQMKSMGFQVEGTEWTQQSAARVPHAAGINIHVGDLLSLTLPRSQYDLITLWHVLEHLRDPHKTLMETRRLLKPGGTLILALPNFDSWQAQRFGANWFHHDPPRHLFSFGVKSLSKLLRQCDYSIERTGTWSLEQNPYGFIQSWLNQRSYPRDQAYSTLKGLRESTTRGLDLTWVTVLTIPALVHSVSEAIAGRGATMTIVARTQTLRAPSSKS